MTGRLHLASDRLIEALYNFVDLRVALSLQTVGTRFSIWTDSRFHQTSISNLLAYTELARAWRCR
jgi:hypothetical protein